MKSGPDRRYTPEFRDAAVKQVIEGGRPVAAVARSLEMSNKSLANWVYRARRGQEQIERVMGATIGMYGDLQGIAGKSLQEIEGLELQALELDDKPAAE